MEATYCPVHLTTDGETPSTEAEYERIYGHLYNITCPVHRDRLYSKLRLAALRWAGYQAEFCDCCTTEAIISATEISVEKGEKAA